MPINLDGYEDLRLLRAFFEEASFVPESFRMQGAGGSSPPSPPVESPYFTGDSALLHPRNWERSAAFTICVSGRGSIVSLKRQ